MKLLPKYYQMKNQISLIAVLFLHVCANWVYLKYTRGTSYLKNISA